MISPELHLFHRIADPPSAKVRRFVVDYALEDRVRFRNLAFAEVEEEFHKLGGHTSPALWDGVHLHQGAEAALARLMAVVNLGRDSF